MNKIHRSIFHFFIGTVGLVVLASCVLYKKLNAVTLINVHTGEELRYTGDVDEFSWLVRDHRKGVALDMDPKAIEFLIDLYKKENGKGPIYILSGYRSKESNKKVGGVKNSQHMYGKAIDFRWAGWDIYSVYQRAVRMKRGGVGIYTHKNFLHIDTGEVRTWGA